MENPKKSSNNNMNINIEQQIASMLENVLKEDSDDSTNSGNKNKTQTNKNKLNLNFPRKDRKFIPEKNDPFAKQVHLNYHNQISNCLNNQIVMQPKLLINSFPLNEENVENNINENKEFFLKSNKNSQSPTNSRVIPNFNNLSPINRNNNKINYNNEDLNNNFNYKININNNNSPRVNNIEDNVYSNIKTPQKNRLFVNHASMGYNQYNNNNNNNYNQGGNPIRNQMFFRNNTINHSNNLMSLNIENNNNNNYNNNTNNKINNIINHNSSTCTTNR